MFTNYIVYVMIFLPFFAAVFITLIPTADLSSKMTLSRFFALIGFFCFLCVLALFINDQLLTQYLVSFKIFDFYVNFAINITRYNIFLFGAMSASLLANMILYELGDTKSNAHQVAPFILTFVIFITLGQKDLRVALPIISMSNFIIYFLIGYGQKLHRSSTIFHMGIFLFTCDALVLILLQYQEIDGPLSPSAQALKAAVVVTGLARLGLPLCAPFLSSLFDNLDEAEGPFLITYLQISGFAILVLIRSDLILVPNYLIVLVAVTTVLSSLYLALAAIFEQRPNILPYYALTFYSAFTACVIFLTDYNSFWHLSASLLLSNIACFLHCSKSSLLLSQYQHLYSWQPQIKATWFISLCLMVGVPGLGIGTALWSTISLMIFKNIANINSLNTNPWFYWSILWCLAMILFSYALLLSHRRDIFKTANSSTTIFDYRLPVNRLFYMSPLIIALLTLIIPLATFYVSSRVLP